jgi:hypothetical protein
MKYTKIFFAALLGLGMTACSLDREPLDPNTDTHFNKDAVFAKCYATFGTTGQKGPDGSGDVDGIDEGTSSFYRMFWELNEFCTDEGWWIWNDVGLADIRTMTWSASNDLVYGLYSRLNFDITLCNSFLDNTSEYTDAETLAQRAEVRMLRAINFYYLLDMFYSVPFSLTVSPNKPKPISRQDLFTWLEKECLELANDPYIIQAGMRTNKYRVDQACAWFLLMRMYLNAEVYNESALGARDGEPRYADAKLYAKKLMDSSYELHGYDKSGKTAIDLAAERTADHVYFSAYQQLFMGDNDNNGAQNEAIFLIYQDAIHCLNWGGARFLVSAVRDANYVPFGSTDTWSCFRSSPEFVFYWVDKNQASSIAINEYQMPIKLGDDRAIMASKTTAGKKMSLSGNEAADFYASWSVLKFTGVYSTAKSDTLKDIHGNDSIVGAPWTWASPVGEPKWPDTDIPLFRLAEAYLTYAEACYRTGESAPAVEAVNCLRRRANAPEITSLDDETLLTEWAKEFWCEGRRRTDLIRYGQFAGATATKLWEGHKAGKDAKYNVYPIPEKDVTANENLKGINESIGY